MRYREFKRTLDILVSSAGLAALSPLMLLTAIAIKVESDGPVIFRQKRIGLSGKTFWMFKFRSMCVGAEKAGFTRKRGIPGLRLQAALSGQSALMNCPSSSISSGEICPS